MKGLRVKETRGLTAMASATSIAPMMAKAARMNKRAAVAVAVAAGVAVIGKVCHRANVLCLSMLPSPILRLHLSMAKPLKMQIQKVL
jgi:hypothetical protein